MSIAIMFFLIGLRLLWSGGVQLFAAYQVAPERNSFVGGRVFREYGYSGVFDILLGFVVALGSVFGRFALDLNPYIIGFLLVLFWFKHRAVDRLALTVAGLVKAPKVEEK